MSNTRNKKPSESERAPREDIKPDITPHETQEHGNGKSVECELVKVVELLDGANLLVTEGEHQRKENIIERLIKGVQEFARNWYDSEYTLWKEASHPSLSTFEREYQRWLKEITEDKTYARALESRPDFEEQIVRILFELYRNRDYYERHEKTEWHVAQEIVRRPVSKRVGKLKTLKTVGETFRVFTTIKAKPASKIGPEVLLREQPLSYLQRKATTSGLLRTAMLLGTEGEGDALEPVRGLPLPPSLEMATQQDAEKYAEFLLHLIEGFSKAGEMLRGRIEVISRPKSRKPKGF